MKKKRPEPRIVRPDDVNPHHDWKRPLQAPGRTQVDFEERINFRRLHDYRLARVRAARCSAVSFGRPNAASTRLNATVSSSTSRSSAV